MKAYVHPKTLRLLLDLKALGVKSVTIDTRGVCCNPRVGVRAGRSYTLRVGDALAKYNAPAITQGRPRKVYQYHGLQLGDYDLSRLDELQPAVPAPTPKTHRLRA